MSPCLCTTYKVCIMTYPPTIGVKLVEVACNGARFAVLKHPPYYSDWLDRPDVKGD